MSIQIVIVKNPNSQYYDRYCTFNSIDTKKGLIPENIIGLFSGEYPLDKDELVSSFSANSIFKKLMHEVIEKYKPLDISFQEEVKREKDGWVYLIDGRCKDPNGRVFPCDIIGAFRIENSKVLEYKANNKYMLYTKEGFFRLDNDIEKILIEIILSKY